MAKNTQLSSTSVNAQANATAALLDGGLLRIYDGSQPADANTAITTQVKLAELTFGTPAFGAASAGVVTANAITGANAVASGTPTWCRTVKADGTTVVFDGTVDTSGPANLIVSASPIASGAPVSVSSLTYTVNASTTGF